MAKTIAVATGALFGAALVVGAAGAEAATVTFERTLNDPNPTVEDLFGFSVALDNGRALVGSLLDRSTGTATGQASLFDVNTGALLQTFADPTPTGGDRFGQSVSIAGDRVLIGANEDDTFGENVGQAHLFDANSGTLLRTFNGVVVDGSLVFHGAPRGGKLDFLDRPVVAAATEIIATTPSYFVDAQRACPATK